MVLAHLLFQIFNSHHTFCNFFYWWWLSMQQEFCHLNVVDLTLDLLLSFPLLGRKRGMFHDSIYCKVGGGSCLPNLTYSCSAFSTILRLFSITSCSRSQIMCFRLTRCIEVDSSISRVFEVMEKIRNWLNSVNRSCVELALLYITTWVDE